MPRSPKSIHAAATSEDLETIGNADARTGGGLTGGLPGSPFLMELARLAGLDTVPTLEAMNPLTLLISRVANLLLRAVFLLAGLVFVAGVIVIGLMLAAALILTSLLRGRKPVFYRGFTSDPRAAWARFRPRQPGQPGTAARRVVGEIVDVEVRDVTPVG
jgi:hypothetical protein